MAKSTAHFRNRISATLLALAAICSATMAQERAVTVFAAASLQTVLDRLTVAWQQTTGNAIVVSYGATSLLARQIELGAPADIFISADRDWMAYLSERGLVDDSLNIDLLGNRLVLIGPVGSVPAIEISAATNLEELLGADGRLAIANTVAVPAGRYARAALEALGLWDNVAGRLAAVENVRVALALVSRGEAPIGIVYATDARADPSVGVIGIFPEWSHPPIVYAAAKLSASANVSAEAFMTFLQSAVARCIFEEEGFVFLVDTEPMAVPSPCPDRG